MLAYGGTCINLKKSRAVRTAQFDYHKENGLSRSSTTRTMCKHTKTTHNTQEDLEVKMLCIMCLHMVDRVGIEPTRSFRMPG